MSNSQILLVIAGLLLLIIIVYKLPIHRCPKCKNPGREIVHTFYERGDVPPKEMHYLECKNCGFSWNHKIVRKKSPR